MTFSIPTSSNRVDFHFARNQRNPIDIAGVKQPAQNTRPANIITVSDGKTTCLVNKKSFYTRLVNRWCSENNHSQQEAKTIKRRLIKEIRETSANSLTTEHVNKIYSDLSRKWEVLAKAPIIELTLEELTLEPVAQTLDNVNPLLEERKNELEEGKDELEETEAYGADAITIEPSDAITIEPSSEEVVNIFTFDRPKNKKSSLAIIENKVKSLSIINQLKNSQFIEVDQSALLKTLNLEQARVHPLQELMVSYFELSTQQFLESMKEHAIVSGTLSACYLFRRGFPIWQRRSFIAFKVVTVGEEPKHSVISLVQTKGRWHQWDARGIQPKLLNDWKDDWFDKKGNPSKKADTGWEALSALIQYDEFVDLEGNTWKLDEQPSRPDVKSARKT